MWTVNFEDGSSLTSKNVPWTELSGKRITGLQLHHPHIQKLYLSISDYDLYYYVVEAIAGLGQDGRIVAMMIGGHDLDLGVGAEIRMEENGSVKFRTYPISKFRYSKDILKGGVGRSRGIKQVQVPA